LGAAETDEAAVVAHFRAAQQATKDGDINCKELRQKSAVEDQAKIKRAEEEWAGHPKFLGAI
jgi:hypothetical protein